jgi:hypothetical protein
MVATRRHSIGVFLAVVAGVTWMVVQVAVPLTAETSHWAYVPRLIAFLLIAGAIIDKNRSR